jgi:rifampicin phosphotransferase
MTPYVLCFQEIDRSKFTIAGGKGANLGELSRIPGIHVPEGFCVTTAAYKNITEKNKEINSLLDELMHFNTEERANISAISAKIRMAIERMPISKDIAEEIVRYLTKYGEKDAFAMRSSATAEDLPTASFAGQQDAYLNIIGKQAILEHISKCWESLFSERAVIYRIQNGFDHRNVLLSVVVQKMVFPQVAGILFTADPVSSNRKVSSIEASFGLGEVMVSGLVNVDNYKLCEGKVVDRKISTKNLAIYALKDGGTKKQEIEPDRQNRQALTDKQILELGLMGRKIEEHFGCPQDIDWCLVDDMFYFVQSRPITTLYPIPETNDQGNRVYVSVGHQQMMTDPMKPLGLSFFQLIAFRPMFKAGGRLFVDVTDQMANSASRAKLLDTMAQHDPLIKDALLNIMEREDFIKSVSDDPKDQPPGPGLEVISSPDFRKEPESGPGIVAELIKRSETSIAALKQEIQTRSGADLFDLILENIQQLKKSLSDPQNIGVIMAAISASSWINEKMRGWLGLKNGADTLSQSVPYNITSEMGLELLDVADVIRLILK